MVDFLNCAFFWGRLRFGLSCGLSRSVRGSNENGRPAGTTAFGLLEDLVDIDVAIGSNGCRRSEMTDAEYENYWEFCLKAIEHRSKR